MRVLLFLLAGAAAGSTASLPITPLYVADARVIIQTGNPFAAHMAVETSAIVASEAEILRSRELAHQTLERNDFVRGLASAGHRPALDAVLSVAGFRTDPLATPPKDRALSRLEENLSVLPVGQSRVIEVRYRDADPVLAAKVANAVVETYVADRAIVEDDTNRRTAGWLKSEIGRLERRVAEADRRLERHRSGANLRDIITGSSGTGGVLQQLNHLTVELAKARSDQAEAGARADVIRRLLDQGSSGGAAWELVDSPLVRNFREQQIRLQAQKAELASTYLPDHPRLLTLQAQLKDLDRQIQSETGKVLEAIELSAEIAAARVASLEASVRDLSADIPPVIDHSSERLALESDARSQRDVLEALMTRMHTLNAAEGSSFGAPGARIISRAKVPAGPGTPRRWLWALGGALAGMAILAFGVVRGGGFARPAPAEKDDGHDLEDVLAVPDTDPDHEADNPESAGRNFPPGDDEALVEEAVESLETGDIGDAPQAEPAFAIANPDLPELPRRSPRRKAAYQVLADAPGTRALAAMLRQDAFGTVLFAGSGASRTHDALALAVAAVAASDNRGIIVVDIGCRRSDLLSPDDGSPGLGELISGQAKFGQVIRKNVVPGVDAIAMGRAWGNPPLTRLGAVIDRLGGIYPTVVVVTNRATDWPDRVVRPDLAVMIYDREADTQAKRRIFDDAIGRGARQAVLVRDETIDTAEIVRAAA